MIILVVYDNSFFIETYGCTFNQSDETQIKSVLIENGYIPCAIKHAKYIIINTCAVKSPTQDKILNRIRTINLEQGQKLIISGCLPWISKESLNEILTINKNIIAIIDLNSIDKIHEILKRIEETNQVIIHRAQKKIDKSKFSTWINNLSDPGIIPICEGCNNNCSYCCTKISRGTLVSYNIDNIIEKIKFFLNKRIKEILLTAQDCGCYNWENSDLSILLKNINLEFSNSNFLIRLGMMDPLVIYDKLNLILKELITSKIFYKFLHIPIQSASNNVLIKMKRKYTSRDLYKLFEKIRAENITISTDVICGFPTESDDDFYETLSFINYFKPDIINISKFTPRPNTAASKMKQLSSEIIKSRSDKITQIYNNYAFNNNKKWLNWEGLMLINQFDPEREFPFSGRNEFFKPIVLKNGNLNEFLKVKVVNATKTYLIGEIIDN